MFQYISNFFIIWRRTIWKLFDLTTWLNYKPEPSPPKIDKLDIYKFKDKQFKPDIYELINRYNINIDDVMWIYYADYVKAPISDIEKLLIKYRAIKVPDSSGYVFLVPWDLYANSF